MINKILLLSVTAFLLLCVITLHSQSKSVLFIGNSYTFYNDGLPTVLKNVANSLGDVIETEMNAPGGYTFQAHAVNSTTLDLISSRAWDYVVLQEQSQRPSFPPSQVATEVYPYAQVLSDSVHNNSSCTQLLFFMTWGYLNGDASNCPYYTPLCTYEGMQWRLRQSYVEMAEANNAWAVPCGMAVKSVRETNPEISLYAGDGSHPSIHGTYLAACTFYASIFHKSPVGASYISTGISESEATILQTAAWNVFADSLDIWLIDTTTVRADFEPMFLTKSVEAQFENYSENADSCFWVFGDETEEWQYPIEGTYYNFMYHTYPAEAEYDICLTAYKGCSFKKTCKTRYIFISDIVASDNLEILAYPNPVADGILKIENANDQVCRISDQTGRLVAEIPVINNQVSLSELAAGTYSLQVDSKIFKIIVF
jgi:hypothetical protein